MNLSFLADQRTIASAERELRRLLCSFVAFYLAIYSFHVGLDEDVTRLIHLLLWPIYLLRLHGSVEYGQKHVSRVWKFELLIDDALLAGLEDVDLVARHVDIFLVQVFQMTMGTLHYRLIVYVHQIDMLIGHHRAIVVDTSV